MKPKKIPYGLTDYKRIKEEGYKEIDQLSCLYFIQFKDTFILKI